MDTRIKVTLYYCIIFLFIISDKLNAQDFIVADSLVHNGVKQEYLHISFGKHSGTKFIKIVLCNENDAKSYEKEIIRCAEINKLEYSEFYLVPIPIMRCKEQNHYHSILNALLMKIDEKRMKLNLSTTLIPFKYSFHDDLFVYETTKPLNSIKGIKDYKYIDSVNYICDFLLE